MLLMSCDRRANEGTELEGSRIVLRKSVDDAISRARGRFKLDGFESTDEAMRAIRGRAPGDPLDP